MVYIIWKMQIQKHLEFWVAVKMVILQKTPPIITVMKIFLKKEIYHKNTLINHLRNDHFLPFSRPFFIKQLLFIFFKKELTLKTILITSFSILVFILIIALFLKNSSSNDRLQLNSISAFFEFTFWSFLFLESLVLLHFGIHFLVRKIAIDYISYIIPFIIISMIISVLLFILIDSGS